MRKQLNKVCILIACIHWAISFFTDKFIFEYVTWDFSNFTQMAKTVITYGCKAVFFVVLVLFWHGIFWFLKKADRRFVKFTLIYFGINLLLLLLVWPGIWRMDEFGILSNAVRLQPVFWQNYLTSLFYVFSLMLLPFPSGVVIVQMAVCSLVVGYILSHGEEVFTAGRAGGQRAEVNDAGASRKIGKKIYFLYLPFLFLPVLDSNLYPMRMSVYGFLELLLVFMLFEYGLAKWSGEETEHTAKHAEKGTNTELLNQDAANANTLSIKLALLGAVVTVWRTEAIYYIVAMPILLVVLFWKKWTKQEKKFGVIAYLICTLVLFVPQQVGNNLTSGNEYDLTSVVLPLVPLVEEAERDGGASELLTQIDKVISVEETLEGASQGKSGISLYWSNPDFKRTGYTDEDYSTFKSAYYKLILKYPATFLKERWTSFVTSTGLLEDTTKLFTTENVPNYEVFQTYPLSSPISNSVRTGIIKLLELRDAGDYNKTLNGYGIVYSAILPIVLLAIGMVFSFVKGNRKLALLLATPLAKVALIFLTAPSRLFMYYYSVYLIGYVLVSVYLIWLSERKYCTEEMKAAQK